MRKKAVVLAGSRGIGKEIANHLELINMEVTKYSSKQVDTSNLDTIELIFKENTDVDVLVLNTGGPPSKSFFDITDDDWQRYHNQLFLGFIKILKNLKINEGGYVFLISSFNVKEPDPKLILSNSYRIAFISVFKSLSKLFADKKISFINIAPGPINTDRLVELKTDIEALRKKIPMGYIAEPEEIGKFISSIVQNNIKYLSGVTINFDGAAGNYIL